MADHATIVDRVLGVFKLDAQTFESIEHDTTATGQAAGVVAAAAVASTIGSSFGGEFSGLVLGISLITPFIGWGIWSALTLAIGTSLFDGKADLGEMLRVIGFAYAPQMLAVIPCVGSLIGGIWSLVAAFIAIRQGLDLDNVKTAITVGIGFIVYVVIAIVLAVLGGISAGLAGAI
jgi:hypothetical protein